MSPRSCRSMHDLVDQKAYGLLDDPASFDDLARVDAHLAQCGECRERFAREQAITESLEATALLSATVSVDERVMAAVRLESARRLADPDLTRGQKAALGGTAIAALFGEAILWVAIVLVLLNAPLPGLAATLGALPEILRPFTVLITGAVDVALVFGRALATVLRSLSLLLPSPEVAAALFVATVSFLTFIAVRRDLHRSPAAVRGLR